MKMIDVQVDRLVGPTHHFGGLGIGNTASHQHGGQASSPAAAALQGLEKMRLVALLGVPQVILPPQFRPDVGFLRSLGFTGSDADVLRRTRDEAPLLLSAAASCSAMWTANAATVTPAIDGDRRSTMITTANLVASVHRAIEPPQTMQDLRQAMPSDCQVLDPLPGGAAMRDEGAANHMRLGTASNSAGINVFVYGDGDPAPSRFWPRQTRAACEAIARQHRLPFDRTMFLKQHPRAIDAGGFHNDVVALSHQDLLIHHELAFAENCSEMLGGLEKRYAETTGRELIRIEVAEQSLSIEDAVQTYLFNSQVVSPANGLRTGRVILCPAQVRGHEAAKAIVDQWCASGLFEQVHYVDLDQSMHGGGGPACLRLRVPLTEADVESLPAQSLWSEELHAQLRDTIRSFYVTELTLDELARVEFCEHAGRAHEVIARLLAANST